MNDQQRAVLKQHQAAYEANEAKEARMMDEFCDIVRYTFRTVSISYPRIVQLCIDMEPEMAQKLRLTAPPAAASSSASSAHPAPPAPAPQQQTPSQPPQQPAAMHSPQSAYMQSHHSRQPQPQTPRAQPHGNGINQQHRHCEHAAPVHHGSIEHSNLRPAPLMSSLAGPQQQQTNNQMLPPSGPRGSGYNRHQNQMNPPAARPEPQMSNKRRLFPAPAPTVNSAVNNAPGMSPPAVPTRRIPVGIPVKRFQTSTPVARRFTPSQRFGSYGQRYVPSREPVGSWGLFPEGNEDPTVSGYSSRAGPAAGKEGGGGQKQD